MRFTRLFEPLITGRIELKNRLVCAPMTTGFEEENYISERSLEYYRRVAVGGVGLIVLGNVLVQPQFIPVPTLPGLYDDRFIPGMKRMVEVLHDHGCKLAVQLFCPEYDYQELKLISERQGIAAANNERISDFNNICNRLTIEQIHRIQELFVDAARRAQQAGADIIQVHGDRLIGMFSSALLNQRTDDYGGSVVKRSRFAIEVVKKIREVVGEMPVDYKLALIRTCPPMGKAGPTVEEARVFAPLLGEAGVDMFHVTLADHHTVAYTVPVGGRFESGCFVDLAREIKKAVTQPVTAVGRIVNPEFAENLLQQGDADLIGLCRALICDPGWPIKTKNNRLDEIRSCIMCNQGCMDHLLKAKSIGCTCNPLVGKEAPPRFIKNSWTKRVMVVGGGPAGMEAACIASGQGHRVTLLEKQNQLGGNLKMISQIPFKNEFQRLLDYLVNELKRLNVDVRLDTRVNADLLLEEKPDVAIIATGAKTVIPIIPGNNRPLVVGVDDVFNKKIKIGQQVIVYGGDVVGIETAEFLAQKGKQVTLIEPGDRIGKHVALTLLPLLPQELKTLGIGIQVEHHLEEFVPGGISVLGPGGKHFFIPCHAVVIAREQMPDTELAGTLASLYPTFKVICAGDCRREPQYFLSLEEAIHDGYMAGLSV